MTIEDIRRAYLRLGTLDATAADTGLSHNVVVKALVTTGDYYSPLIEQIAALREEEGVSSVEICDRLKISRSTLDKYTPYTKGAYSFGAKTENAKRIAMCRERKKNAKK